MPLSLPSDIAVLKRFALAPGGSGLWEAGAKLLDSGDALSSLEGLASDTYLALNERRWEHPITGGVFFFFLESSIYIPRTAYRCGCVVAKN